MGRLESVRLQVRVAEVWLVTTGGSVLMFGASHTERGKSEPLILTFVSSYSKHSTMVIMEKNDLTGKIC